MKVLDLHCPHGHLFEGWFASEDDFQGQLQRQLVLCPVCGHSDITKRLSAPPHQSWRQASSHAPDCGG